MAEDYGYDDGLYGRAVRALSGARDWISERTDPNRPRKRGTGDVNLPVESPIEKPWYDRIPTPESIGERIGQEAVTPVKQTGKGIGDVVVGAVGALSESAGRMGSAAADVFKSSPYQDVRNTGSETKPVSDIAWEGLKGIKSGYDKPWQEVEGPGTQIAKYIPEEYASQVSPFGRAAIKFAGDLPDVSNLVPGKAATVGLAKLAGMAPELAKLAWLPPSIFKAAHNIEGFTSGLRATGDAKKIIQKGFKMPTESDILKRLAHGSAYTPEEGAAARGLGIAPIGSASDYQMRPEHMPLDFNESVKILDTTQPIPREDIDVILDTLHPVHDKNLINEIEEKWQKQAKWVTPHDEVRSGKITPETLRGIYESNKTNPNLKQDVKDLESVLIRPYYQGVTGKANVKTSGTAPLNFPAQTREYGATYHTDKNASGAQRKSVAWDPEQTLIGPAGSQRDLPTVPWTQGKAFSGGHYTGTIPGDAPGGVSVPLPKSYVPSGGPTPNFPVEPAGYTQQQAIDWAAQNIPEPEAVPKVYPEGGPQYKGAPISTYEQGTLKELAAAGRQLSPDQTKKLAAIQQYESGVLPVEAPKPYSGGGYVYTPEDDADNFAQLFESPTFGLAELADQFHAMSPEAQQAYKQKYANDYSNLINSHAWQNHPANKPPPAFNVPEPEPRTQLGKVEVFNANTGQTLGTFDDHASAYRFMDNHPEKSQLDYETLGGDPNPPHPDEVMPSALPEGFEGFDDVPTPSKYDEDIAELDKLFGTKGKSVDQGYKLKIEDASDVLGGQNINKQIYTKDGQDYLFKQTNPSWVAEQEVSAVNVANLAGLHPTKITTETVNGKTGSMQAAIGNNFNWPTLKEVDLTTLTAEELRDVIKNHPVDWLTGNMDAHGAQFLRTPNGIVEVDRGRAFKNYKDNKLHEDYNPTGGPGYYDQVYNDIIKLYKKGDLPQLTEGDIKSALDQTIFKMNQNYNPILTEIFAGLDRSNQSSLKNLATDRFKTLQTDMLKFWSKK